MTLRKADVRGDRMDLPREGVQGHQWVKYRAHAANSVLRESRETYVGLQSVSPGTVLRVLVCSVTLTALYYWSSWLCVLFFVKGAAFS